ncbi:hypothetical protein MUP77_00865, partial [Candidatus Bathyarchaeota archaeon]|nr:hypothetical protein [Candidatus Bathyarchaeota archaeon]
MMNATETRTAIVNFVQSYYAKNKTAPSVRIIAEAFKAKGIDRCSFYTFFAGGLEEVCIAANIPVPERSRQTLKALSVRKREQQVQKEAPCPTRLLLTEEQTRRILGISHIEKGKDPSIIMNELFDRDASLRKTYNLSFKDTKNVADFLEVATRRRWKLPWLLSIMARLWNSGFMHLDQQSLKCLSDLLTEMKSSGLTPEEFMQAFRKKRGEWENDIKRAYNVGLKDGSQAFESAILKSI